MGVRDELERINRLQDEMERAGVNRLQNEMERAGIGMRDFGREAHNYLVESANRDRALALRTPATMQIQPSEERAAESFMEGLREHAERLCNGLQENQELQMYCYHGSEPLRVLEISMPSENVVALRCVNREGEETHVTGHMHSVTFSFLIHTIVPPEVKRPIGFRMPADES